MAGRGSADRGGWRLTPAAVVLIVALVALAVAAAITGSFGLGVAAGAVLLMLVVGSGIQTWGSERTPSEQFEKVRGDFPAKNRRLEHNAPPPDNAESWQKYRERYRDRDET